MRVSINVTPAQVWTEKDRRWDAGFDYNFGDERGIHHIGTTKADMDGWVKVSLGAQMAINFGVPDAPIEIWTDTGKVVVTAMEWQYILFAADLFMQSVMEKAGALVIMNPIPNTYKNDKWWT